MFDYVSIQAFTDEEIHNMLKVLQTEQKEREKRKYYQLIDNFRKAFMDLKQENIIISYNHGADGEIVLNSIDNFEFT